jgi:hypothetical protein
MLDGQVSQVAVRLSQSLLHQIFSPRNVAFLEFFLLLPAEAGYRALCVRARTAHSHWPTLVHGDREREKEREREREREREGKRD